MYTFRFRESLAITIPDLTRDLFPDIVSAKCAANIETCAFCFYRFRGIKSAEIGDGYSHVFLVTRIDYGAAGAKNLQNKVRTLEIPDILRIPQETRRSRNTREEIHSRTALSDSNCRLSRWGTECMDGQITRNHVHLYLNHRRSRSDARALSVEMQVAHYHRRMTDNGLLLLRHG